MGSLFSTERADAGTSVPETRHDTRLLRRPSPCSEPPGKRHKASPIDCPDTDSLVIATNSKQSRDIVPGVVGEEEGAARRKRRKVALFIAYNGARYSGMQINPGVQSIESAFFDALVECGLLPDSNKETLRNVQWSRAARTDKGVSAACQCVSAKLSCEVSGEIDQSIVGVINEKLPDDIVLLDIRRATNSFNAWNDCYRRRYEYVFPFEVLDVMDAPGGGSGDDKGDPRVARLNTILSRFVGTHCFANFTEGLKGSDDSAKRYVIEVKCGEPFIPPGSCKSYCSIQVYGQSFVLHQIRKMCGLAIAVYLGVVPAETLDVALSPHVRIATPIAPALGLFLESLEFDSYNRQVGKNLCSPISIDGKLGLQQKEYKHGVIYRNIAATEESTRAIRSWAASLGVKWKVDPEAIKRDYQQFVITSDGIQDARQEHIANLFPVTRSVSEFFNGNRSEEVDSNDESRLSALIAGFEERFNVLPKHVIRAPGRVNLIGEHCDYNDFPVIGVATRQGTMIAGSNFSQRRVLVQHLDHIQFEGDTFTATGELGRESGPDKSSNVDWVRYVSWGWKALAAKQESVKRACHLSGARLLVSGDLPRAVGLGSSSSLVTAATLMCARVNRTRMGREETALAAAEGERRGAGTRGGAVDHTVSMCGVKGCAVFVSFSPKLETSVLSLPQGCSFVVVNSGVQAFKGQSEVTKTLYNTRVAECRIGSALVARRLKLHLALTVSSPGQMYNMAKAGNQISSVNDLLGLIQTVLPLDEEVSFDDAVTEMTLSALEVRKRFCLGLEFENHRFKIGRRLRHVFSEAARVERFRELLTQQHAYSQECKTGETRIIHELGKILSASHASLRDRYECSCPEVDDLVEVCLHQGSVGSRITGAGWGGCVLNLVPKKQLSCFVDALGTILGKESIFVVDANAGASVLSL